jgi:phage shock protein PspC (stress-responsive transcriptional regulator)
MITYEPRRAYRDPEAGFLGGVAAGVAQHLGWPVNRVRIGFALLAAANGAGVLLYAALWLWMPTPPAAEPAPGLAAAERGGRRTTRRGLADVGPAVALAALGIGALFVAQLVLGTGLVLWILVLGLGGVALIWRQADESSRERWRDSTGRIDPVRALVGDGGWAAWSRIGIGALMLVTALVLFALRSGRLSVALDVLVATGIGLVGVLLVIGPWLLRLLHDLGEERARAGPFAGAGRRRRAPARLRAADPRADPEERRRPAQVARLARAQERDLRSWLFEDDRSLGLARGRRSPRSPPRSRTPQRRRRPRHRGRLVPASAHAAGRAATREAVVNAAKHAGSGRVDVYAEIVDRPRSRSSSATAARLRPRAVPADRHGVRGSASSTGWSATAGVPRQVASGRGHRGAC